jgi:hypothetical protein
MGEYWTRYILNNGQRMSKRQMNKVDKLEEEILNCMSLIHHLETKILSHSLEIEKVKNGGKNKEKVFEEIEF